MNATPARQKQPLTDPSQIVTKAVVRAADFLQLTQLMLAEILGISPSSASRLVSGSYLLSPTRKKEWELGLLFVRMFRSLDAILGHGAQAHTWLTGNNTGLNGKPAELIRTTEGLVRVVHYLDAYRGRI